MENIKRIERAIKQTIANKQIININNIIINSLMFAGGTCEENEIQKYLNENFFSFKYGFFLFIETEETVFINYSKPLKFKINTEFTYSIKKTFIKSINGFIGFKKHIKENSKIEDTFFNSNNWIIKKYETKYNN